MLPGVSFVAVVYAGSTNISTSVTITAKRLTISGILSCAAYTSISSLSYATLTSFGTSVAFKNMLKPVPVLLTNLRPLTTYTVACAIKTSEGFTSSAKSIAAVSSSTQTSCCIGTNVINSPSSVYGDFSIYKTSERRKYSFIFSLDYLPTTSVTISVTLLDSLGSPVSAGSNIAVSTSTFKFLPSSNSREGSFVILAGASVGGIYKIHFDISGDDASKYSSLPELSVTVVSLLAPLAAPSIKSAYLTDTGAAINVLFDVATNKANIGISSFSCDRMFNFVDVKKTSCIWVNSSLVLISYTSTASYLGPGDPITLTASNLQASCAANTICYLNKNASVSTATVQSPLTALVPTAVMSLPSQISSCSNLTVDVTASKGQGNRPWSSVSWKVYDNSGNFASSFTDYLNSRATTTQDIINVPSTFLNSTGYTISCTVTNFLSQSDTTTGSFSVVGKSAPSLRVLGGSSFSYYASDTISMSVIATFSECATASNIKYGVKVLLNGVDQNVVSSSVNPRQLLLKPYTLSVGRTYTVQFSASTTETTSYVTATLAIKRGNIIVSISNLNDGIVKYTPLDQPLTLDASASYDQDSKSPLSYVWTCSLTALSSYGQDCNSILPTSRTSSVLVIPAFSMNVSNSYSFTVQATSLNNRYATTSLSVQPTLTGVYITLSVSKSKFNTEEVISLSGSISANYAVTTEWTVYFSDQPLTLSQLTPAITTFTAAEASSGINVPVAFAANSFTQGRTYSLRLTAYPTSDRSSSSYSECSITINSPPSGGSIVVSPPSGVALSTSFLFSARLWITSPDNYPLEYQFSYQSSSSSPMLAISSKSFLTYSKTVLSASSSGSVTAIVNVYDSYSASASSTTTVSVTNDPSTNLTALLASSLSSSLNAGDTDKALQAVNAVSATANTVNCSLASTSFCSSLNRDDCYSFPNTCGLCKSGYFGIYGSSNKKCVSSLADVPSSCDSDDDCVFGNCVDNICQVARKECPSSNGLQCSGFGTCQYYDTSSIEVVDCPVTNSKCFAKCSCNVGYGGADCSLDDDALAEREALRTKLCQTIITVASSQEISVSVLDTLISSLQSSFNPDEVTSYESQVVCLTAFENIAALAAAGYLSSTKSSTISSLVSLLSSFVKSDVFSGVSNSSSFSDIASKISDDITKGVLNTLVGGQEPQNLVSEFVQVLVQTSRTTTFLNSSLTPPLTDSDKQAGTVAQGISLGGSGLSGCYAPSGYTQISLTQMLKNPVPNAGTPLNPVLQLSTFSPKTSSRRLSSEKVYVLSPDPLFHISLQFSQPQNFNFSLDLSTITETTNFTLPECSLYDSSLGAYVPCSGCNVSSFTNHNVTYGCYDQSLLCELASGSRRLSQYARELVGDDYAAPTTSGKTNLFGALLSAFTSTFSNNPFALSLSQAIPIIALMGSLTFITVFGSIFFLRWDRRDHDTIIYIKKNSNVVKLQQKRMELFTNKLTDNATPSLSRKASIKRMPSLIEAVKVTYDEKSVSTDASKLLDDVVFPLHLIHIASPVHMFLRAVFSQHAYIAPFYSSSLRKRRVLRWLNALYTVLSNMFVDTLFFQVFFSGTAVCTVQETRATCLTPVNQATGSPLCQWMPNADNPRVGSCILADPPSDYVFYIILAMLTLLIALPLQILMETVLLEAVIEHPDMTIKNESDTYWFGSSTATHNTHWFTSKAERKNSNPLPVATVSRDEPIDLTLKTAMYSAYFDNLTPAEERDLLTQRLRLFLSEGNVKGYVPWIDSESDDFWKYHNKLIDIMRSIGINRDGTPTPLSLRQILLYGRPETRLERKISHARKAANKIVEEVKKFDDKEEKLKNALLVQSFILEQFSLAKRYSLSRQLFEFTYTSPGKMDFWLWLLCWTVIFMMFAFKFVWILLWATGNSSKSILTTWGINFSIGVIQDIFFIQCVKVYIIHVAGVMSCLKQVKNIWYVFNEVYVRNDPATEVDSLGIVQHVSPSCRASRSVLCHNLEASKDLLRKMNDNDAYKCRQTGERNVGWVFALLLIPALFTVISISLSDKTLDIIIPSMLSAFLLANVSLLLFSPILFAAVYLLLIALLLWKFGMFDSTIHKLRKSLDAYYSKKFVERGRQVKEDKTLVDLIRRAFRVVYKRIFHDDSSVSTKWKYLNVPYFHQGYAGIYKPQEVLFEVMSPVSSFLTSSPKSQKGKKNLKHEGDWGLVVDEPVEIPYDSSDSSKLFIPSLVSDLFIKPPEIDVIKVVQKYFHEEEEKIFDHDRMIIMENHEKSELAHQYFMEAKTASFEELLRRVMLDLQTHYDFQDLDTHRHSYSVLLVKHYNEPHAMENYFDSLNRVWDSYQPYGQTVEKAMRDEMFENFVEWHFKKYGNDIAEINFQDFAAWLESVDDVLLKCISFEVNQLRFIRVDELNDSFPTIIIKKPKPEPKPVETKSPSPPPSPRTTPSLPSLRPPTIKVRGLSPKVGSPRDEKLPLLPTLKKSLSKDVSEDGSGKISLVSKSFSFNEKREFTKYVNPREGKMPTPPNVKLVLPDGSVKSPSRSTNASPSNEEYFDESKREDTKSAEALAEAPTEPLVDIPSPVSKSSPSSRSSSPRQVLKSRSAKPASTTPLRSEKVITRGKSSRPFSTLSPHK